MKALFLLLPAQSHYISCFPLAKQLQSLGYEIVFAGDDSSRDIVTSQEFTHEPFRYMNCYEVRSARSFSGMFINTIVGNGGIRSRFRDFTRDVERYVRMVSAIDPDLIFIDEHLSHYYAYWRNPKAKTFLINTKLPSGKSPNVPPLNSTFIPWNNLISKLICELTWWRVFLKKKVFQLANSIAFGGYSHQYFQSRYINRRHNDLRYTSFSSLPDYDNIIGVPSIVLMSGKFNYRWRDPATNEINLHYWNTPEPELTPELTSIIASLHPSEKLIYIAMGSMLTSDPAYVSFIRRFVNAMMDQPDCSIVVATGNSSFSEFLRKQTAGKRVYVFERVPQKALLPFCTIMITHCGLNSIKECIYAGVPMLGIVNPAHRQTDTIGNATRVVHHKIGMSVRIDASKDEIRKQAIAVLSSSGFKTNILQLKSEMDKDAYSTMVALRARLSVSRAKTDRLVEVISASA